MLNSNTGVVSLGTRRQNAVHGIRGQPCARAEERGAAAAAVPRIQGEQGAVHGADKRSGRGRHDGPHHVHVRAESC